MTKIERIVLSVLCIILLISFGGMLRLFYIENTEKVAVKGGTYIEGSVGDLLPLNPWFLNSNDVSRDIASLIFSGLLRYDPMNKKIEEDLATLSISADNRKYTLTLKPDIFWHDTEPNAPHPVTADDVIFTFSTIQDPAFPNPLLHQNFRGVNIKKLDDRTVQFILEKPYAFFSSNLTLGLLPKKYFDGVPINKLDQAIDFGFQPIGCGPYQFVSYVQTDVSNEITLKRFVRRNVTAYKVDRIVFRIFPDFNSLLTDVMNLNGIRLVPRNDKGKPILPHNFKPFSYTLPQYVGLFLNMDRPRLQEKNLRQGLQFATNKKEIVDAIHESQIVDTPLAEINLGDWHYKFDAKAAQGALFASNWNMPEKVRLQLLLERRNTNAVGPLKGIDTVVYLETGASLTLTGALQEEHPEGIFINGIRARVQNAPKDTARFSGSGSWTVDLPSVRSESGALHIGVNIIRMREANGKILDSAIIERVIDAKKLKAAKEEQALVDLYLRSKQNMVPQNQKITIDDLTIDAWGYLKKRTPSDPIHPRINEHGEKLVLKLVTSKTPDVYPKIAALLKNQWKKVGVDLQIDVIESKKDFQDRMLNRSYDILLFGESLLDNLDAYPYWHSSQMQTKNDKTKLKLDAFNLSQYASFEADTLLTRIRETASPETRQKLLLQLNDVIKKDVPAIFLYSPLYVSAYDEEIQGVRIGSLALHADRFATLNDWYINTERQFKTGKNWSSFWSWLLHFFGLTNGT